MAKGICHDVFCALSWSVATQIQPHESSSTNGWLCQYNNQMNIPAFGAQVMDGGDKDLFDILEEMGSKGLPENQCRYVFDSMATAVQQLHMMDLVHHDLKPKNFVRWG